MSQVVQATCTEISRFDSFAGQSVRAVLKSDTLTAKFAAACNRRELYEVWVLPTSGEAFTPNQLRQMCFNNIDELADAFGAAHCPDEWFPRAYKKQALLLETFAPELRSAHFFCSPYNTPAGPVVRIVFGTKKSMTEFESDGLNEYLEPSEE